MSDLFLTIDKLAAKMALGLPDWPTQFLIGLPYHDPLSTGWHGMSNLILHAVNWVVRDVHWDSTSRLDMWFPVLDMWCPVLNMWCTLSVGF